MGQQIYTVLAGHGEYKSRGWVFGLASFLEVTSELKTILAPWLKFG